MEFDKLQNRYKGDIAGRYDARRVRTEKWDREHEEISRLLSTRSGTTLADCPVGTGRFVELYGQYGIEATGFDISQDMLDQARDKAAKGGVAMNFKIADIRKLPAADRTFDTVLCIRFLNWVGFEGFRQALTELSRVAKTELLVTVRHYAPVLELERNLTGVRRLGRQLERRVRKRFGKPGLVFHEKTQVTHTFADLGLHVMWSTCIERREDGTDYFLYQLRKTR